MKPGTRLRLRWFLGFFWILAWASIALATPPSTPITVHLELSHVPTDPHEWAVLTVEVRSVLDAPDTYVELILPDGVSADRTNWVVNLQADTPVTLTPTWRSISSPGNYTISVRALKFELRPLKLILKLPHCLGGFHNDRKQPYLVGAKGRS